LPSSPGISVVVCTYRRPELLAGTLESLAPQLGENEVIVVDNDAAGSARATAASSPGVRYQLEPRPGLSHARNAGIAAARGRVVAFLDDDARAAPDFLARLQRAFDTVTPRPACAGGRVLPLYQAPRPAWFVDDLLGYLSLVDWSPAPIFLDERRWLAGTNLAVDVAALARVGGFSPRLGRTGANLLSNEEISLQHRLRQAGLPVYYDPSIVVHHLVPAERLTRPWLWRRAFWQGISDARSDREEQRGGWLELGLAAAVGGVSTARLAARLLLGRPTATAECRILASAGYLAGAAGRGRIIGA
jgi:glycosyltransferase involved in cell wall biosynthesis